MSSDNLLTLNEAKNYLRVDSSDDDSLIESLVSAAIEYCQTYRGETYGEYLVCPDMVKQAMRYLVSQWYDQRAPIGQATEEMSYTIKNLLWMNRTNF